MIKVAKEFVCKLDGMSFQTKEEMEAHIIETYVKVIKKEEELADMQSQLENELVDFVVNLSQNASLLEDSREDFDEDEFDDAIYVELSLKDGDWIFHFAISPSYQFGNFNSELRVYSSVEEALKELHILMKGIAYLTSSLSSKYTFLREVDKRPNMPFSVAFDEAEQEHRNHEHTLYIYIKKYFSTSNLNVEVDIFSFDWFLLESKETFFEAINRQIKRIDGPYVSFIEGEVTIEESFDPYQKGDTFLIDGMDVEDLAKRAKRMRLTILE